MFGRRRKDEPASLLTRDLMQLIAVATVETAEKQRRAIEEWGVGTADRWSVDLANGTISFHFSDHIVTGRVHLLGSYVVGPENWLWGWANASVPENATEASARVRDLGEDSESLRALALPELSVPATFADDLTAVAVEVAGLDGFYRAPAADRYTYLGFSGLARVP